MKRKLTATLAMMSLAFFAATAQNADENLSWDIYPDTWWEQTAQDEYNLRMRKRGKPRPTKRETLECST